MKILRIYTDGACSGNPGPGGWAVVVNLPTECKQYSGGETSTTNNRMELMAVLKCMELILKNKNQGVRYEIRSDSAYVVNAINNGWLEYWQKSGWVTRQKEPVKNKDLWIMLAECLDAVKKEKLKVILVKVKGHSGDTFNELCDTLAKKEVERMQQELREKELAEQTAKSVLEVYRRRNELFKTGFGSNQWNCSGSGA